VADVLGGAVAALLAGFAVTLIGLVLQMAGGLRWANGSLLLFCLAAVLFLQVVQLNARARGYAVTPEQVREWYPDFDEPARQRVVGWELRHHRDCWVYLVKRSRICYNCAILALLLGIATILVPASHTGFGPVRIAAIAVVVLAAGVESLALVDAWLNRRPYRLLRYLRRVVRWVAPSDPPVPAPPFDPGPERS
jgi:hypothetical protein